MSFTPVKIKIALNTKAPSIPQNNTLCCTALGTLKNPKTRINTNKLSTDKAFSIQYADWYCANLSNPEVKYTNALNIIANEIQTTDHVAASLFEISWDFLLKTPKSSSSIITTATIKIVPNISIFNKSNYFYELFRKSINHHVY